MKQIISGKVRDVYKINDSKLVIVTTDRISAFDVILKSMIPGKGTALNGISAYWFRNTWDTVPNHLISTDLSDMPPFFLERPERYKNRVMLVKKLRMLPYEFIVRGYLFGSMWEDYQRTGMFCGQQIGTGYKLAEKLRQPVVTPSVKNSQSHDAYISLDRLRFELGAERADEICEICLRLYQKGCQMAFQRGIIIADTKFEFGYDEAGTLTLGDELFTPDSSRLWAAELYRPGVSPRAYDKQFVRDWLIRNNLNGVIPAPNLPEDVILKTEAIYQECYRRITGDKGK